MKRFISILMILCVAFSALPFVMASADDMVEEFKFQIYDQDAWLIGYNGSDSDVVIPDTYEGYNVTAIDSNVFKNNTNIKSVKIPDTVTYIGGSAFAFCTSLESVKFPAQLKRVLGQAFYHCPSLLEVSLPEKVTEIGTYAFGYYEDFKSGDVFTISNFKINGWENTAAQIYASDNKFGFISLGVAFPWSYYVDYNVVVIEKYLGVDSVVTVPEQIEGCDVVTIAGSTFEGNTRITSVTVPNTVTYIGRGAFINCSNLSEINLLSKYISVADKVFEGTAFYNNVNNWENGILYLNDLLIKAKTDIQSVSIKEDTRAICPNAFENCTKITSVIIPTSVRDVYYNAFEGCTSLSKVTFERGTKTNVYGEYIGSETYISDYAFLDCTSLKSVKLHEGIRNISRYAFGYSYEYIESLGYWDYVKNDKFIVYGVKGTVAQEYANQESYTFIEYDFSNETDTSCEHKTNLKNKKQATYFEKGYSGDKICSICGELVEKGKATPKKKLGVPSFSLSSGKKYLKVSYKKVSGAKGYQVKYVIGKKTVTKTYNSAKAATKKYSNLKKGEYKVSVRSFVTKKGYKTVYSKWSSVKKIKVK